MSGFDNLTREQLISLVEQMGPAFKMLNEEKADLEEELAELKAELEESNKNNDASTDGVVAEYSNLLGEIKEKLAPVYDEIEFGVKARILDIDHSSPYVKLEMELDDPGVGCALGFSIGETIEIGWPGVAADIDSVLERISDYID